MSKHSRQPFNVAAEKVVSLKEMEERAKALLKAELSAREKLYSCLVADPFNFFHAFAIAAKYLLTGDIKIAPGSFSDDTHNKSSAEGRYYASGAFLNATINGFKPRKFNHKFHDKVRGLASKAFEQCEDHSKKPVMQRLKPL